MKRTAVNTASGRRWTRRPAKFSYGFAKYIRDARERIPSSVLPERPIETDDVNAPAVFRTTSMSTTSAGRSKIARPFRSTTSPIGAHRTRRDGSRRSDAEVDDLTEEGFQRPTKSASRGSGQRSETLVGSDKRLALVAKTWSPLRRSRKALRRQGDGGVHEPLHLRQALQRNHQTAAGLAQHR